MSVKMVHNFNKISNEFNKIPHDFDWEVYCLSNRDIYDSGVNNAKKAKTHWLMYGKIEDRKIKLDEEEIKMIESINNKSRFDALKSYFYDRTRIVLLHAGNVNTLKKIFGNFPQLLRMKKIVTYYDETVEGYMQNVPNIIKLIRVKNKGCDIGPFLLSIKYLLENKHEYNKSTVFLKIHTKSNDEWRNEMIDKILQYDYNKNYKCPVIYGCKKYCYPCTKFINGEFILNIMDRNDIRNINYLDYVDTYHNDKCSISNDGSCRNSCYNLYVDLDVNPIFYEKYEVDVKKFNDPSNHFNKHGANEYHRISNVNYIKSFAKYTNMFFAGTIFSFNSEYLDIFSKYDLQNEYDLLEDGYVINTVQTKTHAWEYYFGTVSLLNAGKIVALSGKTRTMHEILPKTLNIVPKKYSQINVLFSKSKYAFFMIVPGNLPTSGGYRTLLRYINILNKHGLSVDLYFGYCANDQDIRNNVTDLDEYGMPKCDTAESNLPLDDILDNIAKFNEIDITCNNYYVGFRCQRNYDYIVANAWQTAGAVLKNKDNCNKKLMYIIQDVEYTFYPNNKIMQDQVKKTYSNDFYYYCLSAYLYNHFKNCSNINNVYESTLSYDDSVYFDKQSVRSDELVIPYYGSKKNNRVVNLVNEIIKICSSNKIVCHVFPEIYQETNDYIINHGTLTPQQLNNLYNRHKIGIIFSNSNPSRFPFEMYASGLRVIEYDCEFTTYDLPNNLFTKIKNSDNILDIIHGLFKGNFSIDESFLINHKQIVENNNFLQFIHSNTL